MCASSQMKFFVSPSCFTTPFTFVTMWNDAGLATNSFGTMNGPNGVVRLRLGDLECRLPDDDRQLPFPVDVAPGRDRVALVGIDDARARRLGEEDRILLVLIGVVRRLLLRAARREHLAR